MPTGSVKPPWSDAVHESGSVEGALACRLSLDLEVGRADITIFTPWPA